MIVIPILYKMKPDDVRRQKGVFGNRFWRRSEESSGEEMEKWKLALKAVSNKHGFTLDNNRSTREGFSLERRYNLENKLEHSRIWADNGLPYKLIITLPWKSII
ncbi:unnamed protein product [Microthlaspi erraticum]|uniref:TIR domain-containing protein n=1 Tax=Microthlaspi erraticum TaxID=1685480 RepID=A0A6D2KPM4_9BRAS|nr:unnamed protein product [Microthlaspi erraticum]